MITNERSCDLNLRKLLVLSGRSRVAFKSSPNPVMNALFVFERADCLLYNVNHALSELDVHPVLAITQTRWQIRRFPSMFRPFGSVILAFASESCCHIPDSGIQLASRWSISLRFKCSSAIRPGGPCVTSKRDLTMDFRTRQFERKGIN